MKFGLNIICLFLYRVPLEFAKTVSRSPGPLGPMMPAALTRGMPSNGAKGSLISHILLDKDILL
jgi:hypothetical protein